MDNTAKIEITPPRLFNNASVLMIWAYGTLLFLPVLISFVAISLIRPGPLTLFIPLVTIAATALLVPLGQGNHYVTRRMKSLKAAAPANADESGAQTEAFLVQLTLAPRVRTNLRAMLEDADDFGFLRFDDRGFSFQGDSIQVSVPFTNVVQVHRQNVGMRGLYLCGPRIIVEVKGLPNVEFLEFAERSSALVPQSKRITRRLLEKLERPVQPERPQA